MSRPCELCLSMALPLYNCVHLPSKQLSCVTFTNAQTANTTHRLLTRTIRLLTAGRVVLAALQEQKVIASHVSCIADAV